MEINVDHRRGHNDATAIASMTPVRMDEHERVGRGKGSRHWRACRGGGVRGPPSSAPSPVMAESGVSARRQPGRLLSKVYGLPWQRNRTRSDAS